MDHAYIEEHRIADRYLAHDLTPGEARAFERHFADCPECLDRIALAEIFRQRLNGASAAEAAATPEPPQPVVSLSEPEPEPEPAPEPQLPPPQFGMLLLDQPSPPPETESKIAAFFGQFSGWQLAGIGILAGLLLLAIPSLFFLAHSRELARQVDRARDSRATGVPSLRLTAGTQPQLALRADLAFVVLLPDTGSQKLEAQRVRASIADPAGRIVWTAQLPDTPGGLAIAVPAEVLQPGTSTLLLQTVTLQGETAELGRFPFQLLPATQPQ